MNRQNPGIGWCDYTWSPVTGCLHSEEQCAVRVNCFARKLIEGKLRGRFGYDSEDPFKPAFHENRLHEPLRVKTPSKIFVSDMGELWGEWIIRGWIDKVLDIVEQCPQHIFQFLTKNPKRYYEFRFPDNVWLGTTITSQEDINRIDIIRKVEAQVRFLSIEPVLGPIKANFDGIDWVIIGGLTPKSVHKKKWVDWILKDVEGIPVYIKDNLKYIPSSLDDRVIRREFPEVK